MLWVCLHFPALALNRVEQTLPAPRPLVLEITRRQRRLVWQANAPARAAGISPGMTIPSAQGLCRDLLCVPRNEAAEQDTLRELGNWAYQFTPHIQLPGSQTPNSQMQNSLLLEVGHSLRLFQDKENLARQLLEKIPAGFQPYQLAFCETAFAALLLARAQDDATPDSAVPPTNAPLFFSLQDLPAQSARAATGGRQNRAAGKHGHRHAGTLVRTAP